jgi:hypothetical protein
MVIFEQFLQQLQHSLSQLPKFEDWKDLEMLTADHAKHLIQSSNDYFNWRVDYDAKAHRFPDVIIHTPHGKLGIEVKSSQSKNWETLGGSIQESTKVKALEALYILFAKNSAQGIQLKCKTFEKCVSSVAVTHSPRYLIDMDLAEGQDLFSQLNTTYAHVCELEQPFDVFKAYFQEKAKKSKSKFWFLSDAENERTSESFQKLELRFFNQLSAREQRQLVCEAIVLYPSDLFGYKQTRYENANLFFLSRNVISNSMRDNFSAGGQITYADIRFPQKLNLLLNSDYHTLLSTLLNAAPTLEMQRRYQSQDQAEIKQLWNKEITQALQAQLLKDCPDDVCQSLLKQILVP